jgi:hypothetical protein
MVEEAECSRNIMFSCMKMEKMRLIEMIPGIGGGGIQENDGGGEFNNDTL